MRMNGIKVVDAATGGRPYRALPRPFMPCCSTSRWPTFLLWAVDILVGLARGDRRFVPDLLTGIVVVRA